MASFVASPSIFQLMPENTARCRLFSRKYTKKGTLELPGSCRKRKYLKDSLNASKTSLDDIKSIFAYDDVPDNFPRGAGQEMTGDCWEDILNNLLKIMPLESATSAEDCKKIIDSCLPDIVRQNIDRLTTSFDQMATILDLQSEFEQDSSFFIRSVNNAIVKVMNATDHHSTANVLDHLRIFYRKLLYAASNRTRKHLTADTCLVHFWNEYFACFESTRGRRGPVLLKSGDCQLELDMELSKDSMMCKANPKAKKILICKPDAMLLVKTDDDPNSIESCRALVVEIKTSQKFVQLPPYADSESSSSTESRSSHQPGKLKTQHFVELALGMRVLLDEQRDEHTNLVKNCYQFGLYCDTNRVYLTRLAAKGTKMEVPTCDQIGFLYFYHKQNEYAKAKHGKHGLKFDYKISNYINILRPGHMRALTYFINVLAWHQLLEPKQQY